MLAFNEVGKQAYRVTLFEDSVLIPYDHVRIYSSLSKYMLKNFSDMDVL